MATNKIPTLYIAAALLVPTVVMTGGRYFGQGASQSQAGTVTPVAQVQTLPSGAIDVILAKKTLVETSDSPSPFYFEESQDGVFQNPMELIEDQRNFTPQLGTPEFRLSTILPHKTNPLAIINSKPHRIGDVLVVGWKLVGIDGDSRTIVIENAEGEKITVGLAQKP